MEISDFIEYAEFDLSMLLQQYKTTITDLFNIEDFKIFVKSYIEKANQFEKTTGIPRKYYSEKINLSLFEQGCYIGHVRVKNIYIYIDEFDAVFIKHKKEIARVKNNFFHFNWILDQLDLINKNYKPKIDSEIPIELYSNKKFTIQQFKNFYLRFYQDCLYDVVVRFDKTYHFFYTEDQINEHSFIGWSIDRKDILKIKRMLKLNKIFMKQK